MSSFNCTLVQDTVPLVRVCETDLLAVSGSSLRFQPPVASESLSIDTSVEDDDTILGFSILSS